MLIQTIKRISHFLQQRAQSPEKIMQYERVHTKRELGAHVAKFLEVHEEKDFMSQETILKTRIHVIKTEDFDAVINMLKILRSRGSANHRREIENIIQLLSKTYAEVSED